MVIRIENIEDERVALYTDYSEPQLFHYNEPERGIFIAESPMVIERALDYGARPVSVFLEEGEYDNEAVRAIIDRVGDIDIFEARLSVINKITGFNMTRGILAAFERPQPPDIRELLASSRCVAVLEDVMNPTNLGAIFRSAAALGVDAVLVTSGSTDPFYRRAARVSMGTVFQVPWTYIPEGEDYIGMLHKEGYCVISMALVDGAVPVTDPELKKSEKRAILLGSEGYGLREEMIAGSDHVVIIPMHNGVDSLNVAASSAIAFWELCGKN